MAEAEAAAPRWLQRRDGPAVARAGVPTPRRDRRGDRRERPGVRGRRGAAPPLELGRRRARSAHRVGEPTPRARVRRAYARAGRNDAGPADGRPALRPPQRVRGSGNRRGLDWLGRVAASVSESEPLLRGTLEPTNLYSSLSAKECSVSSCP